MANDINVKVDASSGSYEAMIVRMTEQNRKMYGEAQRGAAQAAQAFAGLESRLGGLTGAFGTLQSAVGGLVALVAGSRLAGFIGSFTSFAEQLGAVSKRTQVAVEDLHALERIVKQNEGSFEQLTTGFSFLSRAIAQSKDPTSEQAKAFRALGITANTTLEAFFQLSDAMKDNLDANNRLLAARLLLGRSNEDLINTMIQGSAVLKQQMDEQKALGVISTDTANKADDVRDKWQQFFDVLQVKAGGPTVTFLSDVAKDLENIADLVSQNMGMYSRLFSGRGASGSFGERSRGASGDWTDLAPGPHTEGPLEVAPLSKKIDLAGIMAADDARKKALTDQAQLLEQLKKQANDAASAFEKLSGDPTKAAAIQINELTEKAAKFADPTMTNLINTIKLYTLATIEKNKEDEKQKQVMDDLKRALDAQRETEKNAVDAQQFRIKQGREELEIAERLANLDIDKLRAAGAPDTQILAEQINLLSKREALLRENPLLGQPKEIDELVKKQEVARIQLEKLRDTSIDVAGEVSRVVTDITTAVIQGTLKWADIGRSILASFVRVALEQFTTFLRNMQQAAQSSSLLSGGGAGGGSGGGLLAALFGGLLNSGGGLLAGLVGFGSAPAGVSGPSFANGGFFSGGGGGGGGGGLGGIGGGIINTVASLAMTAINSTQIGAAIAATVSQALTATLNTVIASLASIPVAGWIAAAVVAAISGIYRIIANQQERPNAKLSGQFEGIAFDPTSQNFTPGAINVGIGRKVGIKNSQAGAIADNLQQRLIVLADQWVSILNIFPDFLSDQIIPALDITNQRLNYNFSNLKFSPGGSRNIQQELESLSGPEGQLRFLDAFIAPIGAGISAALAAAWIPRFTPNLEYNGPGFGSLRPPGDQEGFDKLIDAIKSIATLTSDLATVGAGKFLSQRDLTGVGSMFDQLFSTSDPTAFTEMAGKIIEQLKPITDFLNSAVQQSTDIFGRGLIAAMEAATESDARLAFMNALGSGIKDVVFQGLTEAFIASAQFNDLLAPIQQIIRSFTQEAIETGVVPNINEFRRQILPNIEQIATRGELLGPLIDVLQELGLDIRNMLGLIPPPAETPAAPAPVGPQNITININGTADPEATAREIDKLLRGQLPPA